MVDDIIAFMTSKKHGKPIDAISIDDSYIIAIFEGTLSKFDFRVVYKEKQNEKWSRARQPKHIQWVIDVLTKSLFDKKLTKEFLQYMLELWDELPRLKSAKERKNLLRGISFNKVKNLKKLTFGAYNIKFTYALMYLLMVEEKTNRADAFMFIDILKALYNEKDLYGILNKATHNGRR